MENKETCQWFGVRTIQKPCGTCGKDCIYAQIKSKEYMGMKDMNNEIEELANIISKNDAVKEEWFNEYDVKELAKEIIEAGYGKVENYKKEIASLKIQLEQANCGIVQCSGCELVRQNVIKEFAEKLLKHYPKRSDKNITLDDAYILDIIDGLLEEYGIDKE